MADETQDGPALAQNAASDDEKLAGLVAQVRADLSGRDAATVERAIRSRLDDTGLALDADQVAALVAELAGTGGPAPERIPE